ncbi:MAG: hypothetical protein DBO99_06105 [gamma proteobacterium symbiont of Ctena orbiculata]|nr:MAG: hypothetical protein DBO99_06105 [gamma proteobacterium symbiont of Ctena orbiculata]
MALLRIKKQKLPSNTRGGDLVSDSKITQDNYLERLIKMIPGEAIGAYLIGLEALPDDLSPEITLYNQGFWAMVCLIFVFVWRAILSYEPELVKSDSIFIRIWDGVEWPFVIIASISFVIWVVVLGNPVLPSTTETGGVVIESWKGTLALLLWTPLATYIYTGQRDNVIQQQGDNLGNKPRPGNGAVGNEDTSTPGGDVPNPKDSLPKAITSLLSRDVIGNNDDRRTADVHQEPYNKICLIHAFLKDSDSTAIKIGTGWLLNGRVVTAAHVVSGCEKFMIWVAYDRETNESLHFEKLMKEVVSIHEKYEVPTDRYDIAYIDIANNALGSVEVDSRDEFENELKMEIAGYPQDMGGLTMFHARGRSKSSLNSQFDHDIDTDNGQSGAPVWTGAGNRVIGMHLTGGAPYNRGLIITDELAAWLKQ